MSQDYVEEAEAGARSFGGLNLAADEVCDLWCGTEASVGLKGSAYYLHKSCSAGSFISFSEVHDRLQGRRECRFGSPGGPGP